MMYISILLRYIFMRPCTLITIHYTKNDIYK